MLNLSNTLDGYLKNVEVIGNTVQDANNLANIRSVGDKVEGQELYKIPIACYGDNVLRPDFELGLWNVSNGTAQADSTAIRTKGFLRIRNQAHLVKRFDGKLGCQVILFDENFKYLGQQSYAGGNYVRYDNILPNAKYMKINFLNTTDLNLKCVLFDRVPSNINGVEFVEFQESELEILSPVQLEKVGDVVDRIICKDGVWGVDKNIKTTDLKDYTFGIYNAPIEGTVCIYNKMSDIKPSTPVLCNALIYNLDIMTTYGNFIRERKDSNVDYGVVIRITNSILSGDNTVKGVTEWLGTNNVKLKYVTSQPQFIPLPYDQQVKLRTFAGQTNITFLTEIAGQIKAQVPKSLGATVNTHTEQIADLYNSLDRVKKLEETTVSTIETESSFTTVDATSNGYFEDVKLEGKTLVNLCKGNVTIHSANNRLTQDISRVVNDFTIINTSNKVIATTIYKNEVFNRSIFFNSNTVTYVKLSSDERIGVVSYLYENGWTSGSIDDAKINTIILEGDHTNNPPEFFEGLISVGQDVEEVSVENRSANLFDGELELGGFNLDTGVKEYTELQFRSTNYISVKPNTTYTLTQPMVIYGYNKNYEYIKSSYNTNKNITFTTHSNCHYIRFRSFNSDYTEHYKNLKLMLVEGTKPKRYTPQQSNKKPLLYYNPTTETWEKPILREWDTIEKHSDGKYYYHQRSEEVVLNGSENWFVSRELNDVSIYQVQLNYKPLGLILSDKFSYVQDGTLWSSNSEGITLQNRGDIQIAINKSKLSTQNAQGFKQWLQANPTTAVYQLAKEEVYECTNIDLMTYSGETNYIINSGAISPKSLIKVHNNISNVVKILQEKVSLLENTFIAGLKSVLSGDMYSLATILYPEDFEQNDNTEQDIMVIPE